MPTTPLQIGQLFGSFEILKESVQDWSITDKFEYRTFLKDKSRVDYRCKTVRSRAGDEMNDCPWRVYASLTQQQDVKISRLSSTHICVGSAATTRGTQNTQSWLCRQIPNHLIVTKKTTPKEIIDTIQVHFSEQIQYKAAQRACAALSNNQLEYEQHAYSQLPDYLRTLRAENPFVYCNMETKPDYSDAENNLQINRFHRIFISPSEARSSFQQCRKLVAVDGTFCKARFVQTLMLAVTIDANNHVVLLAWAVVEGENKDSWVYFMTHLRAAIPEVTEATFISDRDKGLMSADVVLGPRITRAFCCFHLRENFRTRHGSRLTDTYFAKIANAKNHQKYEEQMHLLRTEKPAAADYLQSIDREMWVTAFFRGCRYGHNTSNIVESMNHSLKLQRELSILDLLNEIWHSQMALRFRRLSEATSTPTLFTSFCTTEAETSNVWARSNTVRMAGPYGGEVQQRLDRERGNDKVYIVNLNTRTCTCTKFQENQIPCSHAWACILAINQAPNSYFPQILSVATWRNTYMRNWRPVSIENLETEPHLCQPPTTKRMPGRPKKRRAEKGDRGLAALNYARRANGEEVPASKQKCSSCGGVGHNARTCKASHS